MAAFDFLAPEKAWEQLVQYRQVYYRRYIAVYSGQRHELNATSDRGMFWSRPGKCKVHVPLAADIAQASADLLFSEEPVFTCFHEGTEDHESEQQARLDAILAANNLHGRLNEAAETSAALGDVFLKLNWFPDEIDYPTLTVVQGDSAWPEYLMGVLKCVHFFSVLRRDSDTDTVYRLYERYEAGRIVSAIYKGNSGALGMAMPEAMLDELGVAADLKTPIDEMLAAHIPNMRPNRAFRDNEHGRSDFDGLRYLMDSLDEVYSSWMRDIRLAKARLIVPAEYLRRSVSDMFADNKYTYEFDEDVETLVALDIDPDKASGITASQFQIRSAEHAATCSDIIRNIITIAGYSPQTFGLDINGSAQSGTALRIREKKSFSTQGKKQTYWKAPLEHLVTAMVHLDAVLFPQHGSHVDDYVRVTFSDGVGEDISTMSSALSMLNSASAVSTEVKIQMLHPDWSAQQVADEVARVKEETGLAMPEPIIGLGDYHAPIGSEET